MFQLLVSQMALFKHYDVLYRRYFSPKLVVCVSTNGHGFLLTIILVPVRGTLKPFQ